ncbi:MAG: UDP-N-acetylmuramoyl-L-alanine--D-glutamate ligase [Mariprofundaceae bacterium]|nr:UDP-N-acetylmuramoyl-L-alanine--D-glutamate ligase [Mariprofundaceae bacterium]
MKLRKQTHAVIGMGKTGMSVVRFLKRKGVYCEVFDEQIQDFSSVLKDVGELPYHAGKIKVDALLKFDAVWVSPGVPWHHIALQAARDAGIPVQGDLTLFLQYCDAPLIAITGTNGKTTTTQTIQTLLETLPRGCDVGGNIGIPMLDLLGQKNKAERVILELSSFQLERCDVIRPKWAVLLNVQADHADMHASPEDYCAAKLKLFEHQQAGDTAVLPVGEQWDALSGDLLKRGVCVHRIGHTQAPEIPTDMTAGIASDANTHRLFWHIDKQVKTLNCAKIPTRGLHQHINLAVAAQVASDFGVSQQVIREALSSFRGLPHRLRFVGDVLAHAWFDDSKATNPAAAEAALASFDQVIWICGGLLKGLDLTPMVDVVHKHVCYAVVIGKHPEPYIRLLQKAGVSYTVANTMQRAVRFAAEHEDKLPVLLSPAAASMDQFKSYVERGKVFQQTIDDLAKDS